MKLKGIDIEAFRAYKDPENFNFLSSNGNIADLVVIYAPNGFGKTSFFDAIEWSFTNKIRRISGNKEVKKIAEFEKENILRNMYSDKSVGTIRIITDENKILEIETLEIKGSRLTDYAPGRIVKDQIRTKEIADGFHSRNIITSDKIDEFLRFQKPTERYKVLEDFWDDNKNSMIYFNINSMYGEANKVYGQINKRIENNNKDIKSLAFVTKKIDDINNLVDIYNDLMKESKKYMEYDIESSRINEYLNYFTNKKLLVEGEEDLVDRNKSELDELVVEYEKYKFEKEGVILLNKKLNEKKIILQKFDDVEKNAKKLNIDNKRLEQVELKLKNLSIVKDSVEFFTEETNKITNANKEISELLEKRVHIAEEVNKVQNEIIKLNREIEKNNSEKLKIIKTVEKVKQNIDTYFEYVDKIPKYNRILSKLNIVIDLRQSRIDKYLSRKKELQYYLQDDKEILFSNNLKSAKFNRCKELYINIKEIRNKIKDISKKHEKFIALDDKLNEIISVGRILIKENKLTKCPLCNKDYKKFEIMLENLDSNLDDSFGIKEIEEELVRNNELLVNYEKELNKNLTEFYDKITEEIKINNKNYELEKKKKDRSILLFEKETSNLKTVNFRINNIKREIRELGIEDEIIKNKDYEKKFELQIIQLKKELTINNNVLNKLETDLKKYNDLYSESERLINIKKIKIEAVISQEEYKKIQKCLEYLEMKFDSNKTNSELITLSTEFKIQAKNNEILSKKIEELTSEISQYKYEEITAEIDIMKAEIESKSKIIDEYKKAYRKHAILNSEDIQLNQLLNIITHINKLKNEIVRKKENINLIIKNIGYITQNEERINLINKNEEELEKQRKIKKTLDKLNTYKVRLEKVINDKVNLAFNSDCINSIYRRLEPHPNMNNIKFIPDFVDGKATMNIYTYSDDNKDNIKAPILYFSAAQINILSLSIFFAKALQKSNGLETIFMDEPVQHLDSINILSFVDLIRTVAFGKKFNRQMIISTSNSNFYNIIKRKLDSSYYNSKFIELESYGKICRDI